MKAIRIAALSLTGLAAGAVLALGAGTASAAPSGCIASASCAPAGQGWRPAAPACFPSVVDGANVVCR